MAMASLRLLANREQLPNRLLAAPQPITVLHAAAGDGAAAGPPTFSGVVYSGGKLPVKGFRFPVVVDLSGLQILPIVKANLDHKLEQRVGQSDSVANNGRQIEMKGTLNAATPYRDQVAQSAKDGYRWDVSIEADLLNVEPLAAGRTISVNGQQIAGPAYIARKAILTDLGFVSHGADSNNSVTIAAMAAGANTMDPFEKWCADQDFDLAVMDEANKTKLKATWNKHIANTAGGSGGSGGGANGDSTSGGNGTTLHAGMDILGPGRAEQRRVEELTRIARVAFERVPAGAERIEAMTRQAIESGRAVDGFELEMFRSLLPHAPSPTASHRDLTPRVLQAALCKTAGLSNIEKYFDEKTLDATDQRFRHGLGIAQLLMMAARQNGWHGDTIHDVESILRHAFPPFIPGQQPSVLHAASMSTVSLPGILADAGNKFSREAFMFVEQNWRQFAAIGSVRNFHERKTWSLHGDFEFREIGPTGELEHGKPAETGYTNRATTRGIMLGMDRRDIINDDLSVFTGIPKRLGRGGALGFNKVFWTKFLGAEAAGFFTWARNNLAQTPEFGADGLSLAETRFRSQTDPDGNPLGSMPKILLVPVALAAAARRLMSSERLAEDSDRGDKNPWAGRFKVVDSDYLTAGTITGNSATDWYLLADPNDLPVIEAVFLNGIEFPTIRTADAQINMLGIVFAAHYDFGVELQEYRGGVKVLEGEESSDSA